MTEIPQLIAIEFPGYADDAQVLLKLIGGHQSLMTCIANNSPVQLCMRDDLFSRPIYGHTVATSNLLVKIIKQRHSKTGKQRVLYEIIGKIDQTVRFRSLADYQVLTNPKIPIVKLRNDLHQWNVDGIEKFRFSHEKGIVQDLSNLPPPLFSPMETALDYKYAQNPAVVKVRVDEEGGSRIRMINKKSNTDKLHCAILNIKDAQVPTGPPEEFKALNVPEQAVQEIFDLFQNHRPVWSRTALINSMSPQYTRYIKNLLPRVAYLIPRGGYKDAWVRYGFDPRKDSSSWKWQIISMRSTLKKTRIFRGFYSSRSLQTPTKSDTNSHIFTGSNFVGSINSFQICDITDPDILPFLQAHGTPRQHFSKSSGWFSKKFIDHLRKMMTNKVNAIRGEPSMCKLPETFVEDEESINSSSSSLSSSSDEEIFDDLENSVDSRVEKLMKALGGHHDQFGQDDMDEFEFFQ